MMNIKKTVVFLFVIILGYLIKDSFKFNKALLEYFPGLGIALVPNRNI